MAQQSIGRNVAKSRALSRAFPIKSGDNIVLRGRSWTNDYAPRHPEIVEDLKKLKAHSAVLDGELTFFKKERDVFLTALARPETKKGFTAKMMLFDVLFVGDDDVRDFPFEERQKILRELVPKGLKHVEVVDSVEKVKEGYYKKLTEKLQGEGMVLK